MVTISELKKIRQSEAKKLMAMNKKISKARKIDKEKEELIKDIKRIKAARNKDRQKLKQEASKKLRVIKSTGKKVGKSIIRYLQDLRDS